MGLAIFLYREFAQPGASFISFALFMGISMSITAFPVLARILQERNLSPDFPGLRRAGLRRGGRCHGLDGTRLRGGGGPRNQPPRLRLRTGARSPLRPFSCFVW